MTVEAVQTLTADNIGALAIANNLSDVNDAATAFGNIKQAATETDSGVAEIATLAEADTGTDTSRYITPARLRSSEAYYLAIENQYRLQANQLAANFAGIAVYLDTVSGNDGNGGTAPNDAKLSFGAALTALTALGGSGTIYINAPEANKLAVFNTISTGTVVLRSMTGARWYFDRAETITSGWTNEGGGVYSRVSTRSHWVVSSLTGADGYYVVLSANTSTPTTPAAGEFGNSGGNVYVHLPGDADANAHTLRAPQTPSCLIISGDCSLLMFDAAGYYTSGATVNIGGTGTSYIVDTNLNYATSQGLTVTGTGTAIVIGGEASKQRFDGYSNNSTGNLTCVRCAAHYNGDEGFTDHSSSVTTLIDCTATNNGSGGVGFTSDSGQSNVDGGLFDSNGVNAGGGFEQNGISYGVDASGTVRHVTCTNNTGSGIYAATLGVLTVIDAVSGTANGNSAADSY